MVTKQRVAAAAASQAPTLIGIAVVGLGAVLAFQAFRGLPGLATDLITKGGEELAEGTGDFLTGLFTGNEPTEVPLTAIRTVEGGQTFRLTDPRVRDPDVALFNPVIGPATDSFVTTIVENGQTIVLQRGGAISTPLADFFVIKDESSIAQDLGAEVGGFITDVADQPFIDFIPVVGNVVNVVEGGISLFRRVF